MTDFDGHAYLAARATEARRLRAEERETRGHSGVFWAAAAELCDMQATLLERPSPFTASIDPDYGVDYTKARRLAACYQASFGWVHVRPACHCPQGRRAR